MKLRYRIAIGLVVAFIASRYRWNGSVLDGLDLEISEPGIELDGTLAPNGGVQIRGGYQVRVTER